MRERNALLEQFENLMPELTRPMRERDARFRAIEDRVAARRVAMYAQRVADLEKRERAIARGNRLAREAWEWGPGYRRSTYLEALLRADYEDLETLFRYVEAQGAADVVEPEETELHGKLVRLGLVEEDTSCPTCAGTGIGQYGDPDTSKCWSCRGSGERRQSNDRDDY